MRIHQLFRHGDMVRIINPDSPLYGMLMTVHIQDQTYFVIFDNEKKLELPHHEFGPWLGYHFYKSLYRAHLLQLQLLAVDLGDRTWFDEIRNVIERLDNLP
ncbi:hypothetical protein [Ammoniphilus sp. 3BR4]|uniref:hypothetical protein n=1 Tax=Ammoniphilus sp. 3BR4 TaxID=3158265 RepID=UPI00346589D1